MKTKITPLSALRLAVVAMLAVLNAPFSTSASPAPLLYNGDYLGGRLIYDPNTDLTWYQAPYTNVNWYAALDWAANLNVAGVTGWRLPSIAPATVNYDVVTGNPNDGELAHLWYDELGNHSGALTNSGPFDPTTWQFPYSMDYWTSSGPWYAHLSGFAVYFSIHDGNYGLTTIPPWTPGLCMEIAVCAGDVGPSGRIVGSSANGRIVVSGDEWAFSDAGMPSAYVTNVLKWFGLLPSGSGKKVLILDGQSWNSGYNGTVGAFGGAFRSLLANNGIAVTYLGYQDNPVAVTGFDAVFVDGFIVKAATLPADLASFVGAGGSVCGGRDRDVQRSQSHRRGRVLAAVLHRCDGAR